MRKNLRSIFGTFSKTILECLSVVEHLGEEIEIEKDNKSYKSIDSQMNQIKIKLKTQFNMITLVREGIYFFFFFSKN